MTASISTPFFQIIGISNAFNILEKWFWYRYHYLKFMENYRKNYYMEKLLIADHCWSVASFVEVSKETEVYGLDSLVADFGGMLSLFLGVSFMTIWHLVLALLTKLNLTCMWNK